MHVRLAGAVAVSAHSLLLWNIQAQQAPYVSAMPGTPSPGSALERLPRQPGNEVPPALPALGSSLEPPEKAPLPPPAGSSLRSRAVGLRAQTPSCPRYSVGHQGPWLLRKAAPGETRRELAN